MIALWGILWVGSFAFAFKFIPQISTYSIAMQLLAIAGFITLAVVTTILVSGEREVK